MMFKEASVYTFRRFSERERAASGLRVLIMRRFPRGISRQQIDLWIPSAAPEPSVLRAYREGRIPWNEVATVYRINQQMAHDCVVYDYRGGEGRPSPSRVAQGPLSLLHELEREHGTVTLLCWEQEGPCHRFVLKELLEQGGKRR
jgi:uncharacterized protein YeaO (DUF488 family)